MLPDVAHQVVKGDIILYKPFVLRVFDLHLLGNARADKGQPVSDAELLSCIYG